MNISHELFSCYAFYSGLVLAKTLAMSFWTAKRRFANGAFANPEDVVGTPNEVKANEEVERVRRCHQNDLENVLPFVLVGGLYLSTNPALATAKVVFRTFTAARYIHTFVYVFAVSNLGRVFL